MTTMWPNEFDGMVWRTNQKYLPNNKNLSTMTTDSTMFKNFDNWKQFDEKTNGHKIYVQLTNGRCVNVTKKALKEVAASMQNMDEVFQGKITVISGRKVVQVTLQ